MLIVRKLAAVLACTTMLSVVGATTAGASSTARCDKLAQINDKIQAKKARIEARTADRPRAETGNQKHTPDIEMKLQKKITRLEARCSS